MRRDKEFTDRERYGWLFIKALLDEKRDADPAWIMAEFCRELRKWLVKNPKRKGANHVRKNH